MVVAPADLRTNTRRLREIVNIVAYFAGVVLFGALLAPWLYAAGQFIAGHGMLPMLATVEFQKYFNRGLLLSAIVLLWPLARAMRIRSWAQLGLQRDPRARQRFLAGFLIASLCVAALGLAYVGADIYRWKEKLPFEKLPPLLLSALVVAFIEETLFRGFLLGIFQRACRPRCALFWVTFIFASVHFLKPDESVQISDVHWFSGLSLIPHLFHQFAEPMTLLAGFTTLFVLGWVLGDATLRTRSLWLAIGLHAGIVFVKMSFSKMTKRDGLALPWIGSELQIGLVPVAVLGACGVLAWLWLAYVDSPSSTHDR
jgi:membrane protease YdiL (CAAX protease family)